MVEQHISIGQGSGDASRSCCTIQSLVGWNVTLKCRMRRRLCSIATNQFKVRKQRVGTVKKSRRQSPRDDCSEKPATGWLCSPPECASGVADSVTRSVRRSRSRVLITRHGCAARPTSDSLFSCGESSLGLLRLPSAAPVVAGGIATTRRGGIRSDAKKRPFRV